MIIQKIIQGTKSILIGLLFLTAFVFLLILGQGLFKLLQYFLWGDENVIGIAPGLFSFKIGLCSLFAFILGLVALLFLIFKKIQLKKNKILVRVILTVLSIVAIILPVLSLFNCTIFYKNYILDRSGIPFYQKIYSYQDIKKVEVSRFRGLHIKKINYELVMLDDNKLDVTSDEYNIIYIPEIEDKIHKRIPHTITNEAYRHLLKRIRKDKLDNIADWEKIN
jgi:hypothetical protein